MDDETDATDAAEGERAPQCNGVGVAVAGGCGGGGSAKADGMAEVEAPAAGKEAAAVLLLFAWPCFVFA